MRASLNSCKGLSKPSFDGLVVYHDEDGVSVGGKIGGCGGKEAFDDVPHFVLAEYLPDGHSHFTGEGEGEPVGYGGGYVGLPCHGIGQNLFYKWEWAQSLGAVWHGEDGVAAGS